MAEPLSALASPDCDLLVDEEKIPIHMNVLRITSPVFNDLLASGDGPNDVTELRIEGFPPAAVRLFVKCLCPDASGGGRLDDLTPVQLDEVLDLALKYNVRLMIECIARKINSDPAHVHAYLPLVFKLDKHMWSSWSWSKPVLVGLRRSVFAMPNGPCQQPCEPGNPCAPCKSPALEQLNESTYVNMLQLDQTHHFKEKKFLPEDLQKFKSKIKSSASNSSKLQTKEDVDLMGYVAALKHFIKHQQHVAADSISDTFSSVNFGLVEPLFDWLHKDPDVTQGSEATKPVKPVKPDQTAEQATMSPAKTGEKEAAAQEKAKQVEVERMVGGKEITNQPEPLPQRT